MEQRSQLNLPKKCMKDSPGLPGRAATGLGNSEGFPGRLPSEHSQPLLEQKACPWQDTRSLILFSLLPPGALQSEYSAAGSLFYACGFRIHGFLFLNV